MKRAIQPKFRIGDRVSRLSRDGERVLGTVTLWTKRYGIVLIKRDSDVARLGWDACPLRAGFDDEYNLVERGAE